MKNEKEYTEGIYIKENKFSAWFDNFWYHYKWHTIVSIFLVTVIGICTFQMCTKKDYDIVLTYAGPKEFITDPQEKIDINNALSNIATSKFETSTSANLHSYIVYTKAQIEELQKQVDENGKPLYNINTAQITQNMDELETFSQLGDSYIFLLDPGIYEHLKDQSEISERFVKLSTVFDKKPESSYDDYAVKLIDTDLYKNNPALHVLPEDTLICLHARLVLPTNETQYNKHLELFKKLATVSESSKSTETAKQEA